MPRSWRRPLRPILFVVFVVGLASVWLLAFAYLSPDQYARSPVGKTIDRQLKTASYRWRRQSDSYRAAGKDLYETHCATCHGLAGEGGKGPSLDTTRAGITDVRLAEIINIGLPGMPPFEHVLDDEQVLQILAHVTSIVDAAPAAASLAGDARRGEALYRTKGNCHGCHDSQDDVGSVGPDLSDVGIRRGTEYLRQKLIDPSKDVTERYRPVHLETKTGETVTGTTLNEDTFSVQIRALNGAVRSFNRNDLATFRVDRDASFMPSYRKVFGDAELDDLVAYLASLRAGR